MAGIDLRKRYDVIVVGSGAGGGFAAKELTGGGAETLVLEAGPRLSRPDYQTHRWPYESPYRGFDKPGERERVYPRQWTASEFSKNLYIDEREHPYSAPEDLPYVWVRSRFVGGKMLHWGRNGRRLSDYDFRAAERDGYGENWPIRYADLAPYYDKVERFIGVAGTVENIPHYPDGRFIAAPPLTCGERIAQNAGAAIGLRIAPKRACQRYESVNNLPPCHYCGACGRGCDVGAFWDSVSDTLVAAARTGRLTLRPDSVVRAILVDENGKPRGVAFVDRLSKEEYEVSGGVIVLAASALESTRILLNSKSRFWPKGLANSSGVLGHYLMDNIGGPGISGLLPQLRGREPVNEDGKAGGVDIVPYRNIDSQEPRFIRSYVHEGSAGARMFPSFARSMTGYGQAFKQSVRSWYTTPISFNTRGEMLARFENRVEIDPGLRDAWGIPTLRIVCEHGENEREMAKDATVKLAELFEVMGAQHVRESHALQAPGSMIHDMGTARMGADPRSSVLNRFNQAHDAANLFVVDGACFVTSGGYGPTLTIGALAARAADYILEQRRRGGL